MSLVGHFQSKPLYFVFWYQSLKGNIFFHRETSLKKKSTTDQVKFPGLNIDQNVTTDDPAHYQELGDLKNENAYQTLHQRKN